MALEHRSIGLDPLADHGEPEIGEAAEGVENGGNEGSLGHV